MVEGHGLNSNQGSRQLQHILESMLNFLGTTFDFKLQEQQLMSGTVLWDENNKPLA
jgi:hypothetical protein